MADERELSWLRRSRDLVHGLIEEQRPGRLLPFILDAAIELTQAERGFLVTVEAADSAAPQLCIQEARGFNQVELAGQRGKVSRTVVKRVLAKGGLVTSRSEDENLLQVSSVQGGRVLSIIAVPLRFRGQTLGVLYLDHRREREAFREADLPALEVFAVQAALALAAGEKGSAKQTEPAPKAPAGLGRLVGQSPGMLALFRQIEQLARCDEIVLILGESGTGKELVARELHEGGAAPGDPFLAINCAALPRELAESELFGHERGAFTGADSARTGLFFAAKRGTLFLDEIGELALPAQAKLLRALQERAARPVGATNSLPFHCRIIAATHRDLRCMVREQRFREDLYYRLDVLRLKIPSLRERRSDVLPLIARFAGDQTLELSPSAQRLLQAWSWPGNIRELQNLVRRFLAFGIHKVSAQQLPEEIRQGHGVVSAGPSLEGRTMGEVRREMIVAALSAAGGNKAWAARQLGIPRTSLYRLLKRFGIDP